MTLDLLAVQNNTGPKWKEKSNLAFWRGRDSRQERLDLVKMSEKHKDIIDAKLTAMFFFKNQKKDFEIAQRVGFYEFFKVCCIDNYFSWFFVSIFLLFSQHGISPQAQEDKAIPL